MVKETERRLLRTLEFLKEPQGSSITTLVRAMNFDEPQVSLKKIVQSLKGCLETGMLRMADGRVKFKQVNLPSDSKDKDNMLEDVGRPKTACTKPNGSTPYPAPPPPTQKPSGQKTAPKPLNTKPGNGTPSEEKKPHCPKPHCPKPKSRPKCKPKKPKCVKPKPKKCIKPKKKPKCVKPKPKCRPKPKPKKCQPKKRIQPYCKPKKCAY